ncbi:WxL domain-containing protein [Bacillaceae bacterium CLA-AA-H227]|uniref:WxL domain-containing protein n=1 Tax=Robertmurraya yapensis (ex Hitch et al 2024) TaxID=3133160 RepID=A0ACC6SDA0_9BACI
MKKNSFVSKALSITVAFGIAVTAFGTQSFAAGTESTTTLTGGDLTVDSITFSELSTTLTGYSTIATANWGIGEIIDARGTGAGWNLTLELSPFQAVDGTDVGLEASSLKLVTDPIVSKVDETSSDASTITPITAGELGTALDTNLPITLLSAQVGGGMGSFKLENMGVKLTIPANAYAKTYKATATVSLNTAP